MSNVQSKVRAAGMLPTHNLRKKSSSINNNGDLDLYPMNWPKT